MNSGGSHAHARKLLGLIVSEITNPFFPELIQHFENIGLEKGYDTMLGSTNYDPARMETCIQRMMARNVHGIAIMTFGMEAPLIDHLADRKFPLVSADFGFRDPRVASITVDYEHGIGQAVQHLAALGHRDIGFVSGPALMYSARARQTAFKKMMQRLGLELRPQWLPEGDHRLEGGIRCMSKILELRDRPTAVICSNDMTAIGVLHAISGSGMRVPEDLSVIGFDDVAIARFTVPPLTTVRMSCEALAAAAINSLDAQAAGQGRDPLMNPEVVETSLVVRESTTFPRTVLAA